jgi:hypothetical protein
MTIRAVATASIDVTETTTSTDSPASPVDGVSNVRRFNAYNQLNKVLDAATTPKADTAVDLSHTFVTTSKTWDLTAAPYAKNINDTVDLSGKKLVALLAYADPDNHASGVLIKSGASNGYDLFGNAAYGVTLYPGMAINLFQLGAAAGEPAVGATDKTIDLTGTAADVVQILAVFGTQ